MVGVTATRVLDSDTEITEVDIDTAITEVDIDTAITEVDIRVPNHVVRYPHRCDRSVQIAGIGPVLQGVGPDRINAGAQCLRHRRSGVGLGARETPGTEDVVEMVVGHHQVGHLSPGQLADVLGDPVGLCQGRPAVDQQHCGSPVDQTHRDIEERQPAPVDAISQLLPLVMHVNNASCHGVRASRPVLRRRVATYRVDTCPICPPQHVQPPAEHEHADCAAVLPQ